MSSRLVFGSLGITSEFQKIIFDMIILGKFHGGPKMRRFFSGVDQMSGISISCSFNSPEV